MLRVASSFVFYVLGSYRMTLLPKLDLAGQQRNWEKLKNSIGWSGIPYISFLSLLFWCMRVYRSFLRKHWTSFRKIRVYGAGLARAPLAAVVRTHIAFSAFTTEYIRINSTMRKPEQEACSVSQASFLVAQHRAYSSVVFLLFIADRRLSTNQSGVRMYRILVVSLWTTLESQQMKRYTASAPFIIVPTTWNPLHVWLTEIPALRLSRSGSRCMLC